MLDDPLTEPRGKGGRAPDVFRPSAWVPMRRYALTDEVDFLVVGMEAGGGTLACRLAEAGFSVIGLDAGPWVRPLEDFASDEAEHIQLTGQTTEFPPVGTRRSSVPTTAARRLGQHRAFRDGVAALRPEWFKSRSLLGMAPTGRSIGAKCGRTMKRSNRR